MNKIILILVCMLVFVTPVHAHYNHTTENSTIYQDATSCSITSLTNGNNTNWSDYAYCVIGGTPGNSMKIDENYTYNSNWNRSDTTELYATVKWGMNHSYGTMKLYVWNYTKADWSTPMAYSTGNGNYTTTAKLNKNEFTNGTNPVMYYFVSSTNTNSINYYWESKLMWSGDPYITNCSTGGTAYVTFICKDETTLANTTCSIDSTFSLGGTNASFQFRSASSYQVCIDPNETYYVTNASTKYWGTGYSTRYHYLDSANLSSNNVVNLYMLNASDSTLVQMIIKDQVDNPVSDEIVIIEKQDLGTGAFTQVAEAKSDFNGNAYAYLKLHENYKFFLTKNGIIHREYEPMTLESSELTFYVSEIEIPEYFSYYNKVATSCNFENSTRLLTCNYVDTSGLTMNMSLLVYKIEQVGETTVCDNSSTSASGSFVCNLTEDATYRYSMKGTYFSDPLTYAWQTGWINGASVINFGAVGILLSFLLVGFIAFITHYDVRLCIMSTAFAMIFCSVVSLINFGAETMVLTMTLSLIAGLVAFKIKT